MEDAVAMVTTDKKMGDAVAVVTTDNRDGKHRNHSNNINTTLNVSHQVFFLVQDSLADRILRQARVLFRPPG